MGGFQPKKRKINTHGPEEGAGGHPICNTQNPLNLGAGDQGPWNSCAVFAIFSTLETLFRTAYKKSIDSQAVSEAFLMGGHKNRKGDLIMECGTDIPWLIQTVNESGFLFKAEGAYLRATLGHEVLTKEIFSQIPKASGVSTDNAYALSKYCVIAAGGKAGSHTNHALHCADWGITVAPLRAKCENSWGPTHRNPIVPGDLWPRILEIYRIRIRVLAAGSGAGSDWVPLVSGGFSPGQKVIVTADLPDDEGGFRKGTELVIDGGNDYHVTCGGVRIFKVSRLAPA